MMASDSEEEYDYEEAMDYYNVARDIFNVAEAQLEEMDAADQEGGLVNIVDPAPALPENDGNFDMDEENNMNHNYDDNGNESDDSRETELWSGREENDADSEPEEEAAQFDPELPIRHVYLGEGMEELQGRIVWEDDPTSTPEIPLVVMGIHLVPGQILPLTIFHTVFQNTIRRCVVNDRMFGIVNNDIENLPLSRTVVNRGALGTLAEIYEFQEESESDNPMNPSISSSFAIKAKGRSRFTVLEVRRQADGNLMGKVKIRPEIRLSPLILDMISHGTTRYKFPMDQSMSSIAENSNANQSSSMSESEIDASLNCALGNLSKEIKFGRKLTKYYSALTPWPSFVYDQYNEKILVEKIHHKLKELKGLTESGCPNIPIDPTDLSFWVAQNLTMEDSMRLKILKMDNAVQRLKYELELLNRVYKVISCRCQATIADRSDIFSMSIEGPSGTYVNPNGFVHETLTVYKIKGAGTRGSPSTEASWFPGYSWTILECKRCENHIGWKFKAVGGRLKPNKFYGLSRRSIHFKYDFGLDSEHRDNLEDTTVAPQLTASSADSSTSIVAVAESN